MLFNGVINAYQIDATVPEGAKHIELAAQVGLGYPVGPGEMGILPAGTLRIPMDRKAAENLIESLTELIEELPKPSDLTIASNLSQVEEQAERLNKLRDNGSRN